MRDWDLIQEAKTRHWLRRKQLMSPAEIWQVGCELWQQAREVKPGGPSMSERLDDLDVHRRVSQALRAVPHAAR